MVETWMSLHDASSELGVSLRTIQRRVRDGTLRSRRGTLGRCEVALDVTPSDAQNVHQALQVVQAQLTSLGDRPEVGRGSQVRTRRWAIAGWAVAAMLSVVAGGAVRYGVEAGKRADRQVSGSAAATAAASEHAADVEGLRRQVEQLTGEIDALRGDGLELEELGGSAVADASGQ